MIKKLTKNLTKKLTKKQITIIAIVVVCIVATAVAVYFASPQVRTYIQELLNETNNSNSTMEDNNPNNSGGNSQNSGTQGNYAFDSENFAFEVHFIDVGQGDAILIRFSDGLDVLIDAGSTTSGLAGIRENVLGYLASVELDAIDYMIITHPDTDHYNIATAIMDEYEVNVVIYNDVPKNQTYQKFIQRMEEEVPTPENLYKVDDDGEDFTIETDLYSIYVYGPGYDTLGNKDDNYDANESNGMSIVTVVSCADRKLLLMGDATIDTENWFMEKVGGEEYDCDFVKIGHHGSKTSSSEVFLDYILCEYAIIMVDDGKKHNHPDQIVMDRLNDRSMPTYTTNSHGNIVLKVDHEGNFVFIVEKDVDALNNKDNVPSYKEARQG